MPAKKKKTTRKRAKTTHRRRMAGLPARRVASHPKKHKSRKKAGSRGLITQAGFQIPVNAAAFAFGAAVAWNYKDDARFVNMIKDDKMRYAGLALVGLLGVPLLAKTKTKVPAAIAYGLLGVSAAGAIAAFPLFFPKLIPPPKTAADLPPATHGLGRSTAEEVANLRAFIEKNRPGGTNGTRTATLTGNRFSTLTGLRAGKLTGRKPLNVLTGMPQDNSYSMSFT